MHSKLARTTLPVDDHTPGVISTNDAHWAQLMLVTDYRGTVVHVTQVMVALGGCRRACRIQRSLARNSCVACPVLS